ncbi:hypothetical protein HOD20_08390 [archaeon]|jgi:hypothetical protein|nr:hypothetical protein [archaeon]MBT4647751.1 hypothetical protein [archaeon]
MRSKTPINEDKILFENLLFINAGHNSVEKIFRAREETFYRENYRNFDNYKSAQPSIWAYLNRMIKKGIIVQDPTKLWMNKKRYKPNFTKINKFLLSQIGKRIELKKKQLVNLPENYSNILYSYVYDSPSVRRKKKDTDVKKKFLKEINNDRENQINLLSELRKSNFINNGIQIELLKRSMYVTFSYKNYLNMTLDIFLDRFIDLANRYIFKDHLDKYKKKYSEEEIKNLFKFLELCEMVNVRDYDNFFFLSVVT